MMIGAGTLIWSNLYWIGLLVALVLVVWGLYKMWRSYIVKVEATDKNTVLTPSPIGPIIATIVVVGLFVVGGILSWNVLQDYTTNATNYETKAETDYRAKAMETKLPGNEQLDQTKADMKDRAEVQPHQKALNDFDAAMAAEEAKIRARSLGGTTQPAEKK